MSSVSKTSNKVISDVKSEFYQSQLNRIFYKYNIDSNRKRLSKQSVTCRGTYARLEFLINIKNIGDYSKVVNTISLLPADFCSILPYFNFKPVQMLGFLVEISKCDETLIDYLKEHYFDTIIKIITKVDEKIKFAEDNNLKEVRDTGYVTVDLFDAKNISGRFRMVLI